MRGTGDVVYRLPRQARTNQRLHFHVHPAGRFLFTPSQAPSQPPLPPPAGSGPGRGGGPCGEVLVYDTRDGTEAGRLRLPTPSLNGVHVHPSRPAFAASAGQRRYALPHDPPDGPPSPGSPPAEAGPGDEAGWDAGLFVGLLEAAAS